MSQLQYEIQKFLIKTKENVQKVVMWNIPVTPEDSFFIM